MHTKKKNKHSLEETESESLPHFIQNMRHKIINQQTHKETANRDPQSRGKAVNSYEPEIFEMLEFGDKDLKGSLKSMFQIVKDNIMNKMIEKLGGNVN